MAAYREQDKLEEQKEALREKEVQRKYGLREEDLNEQFEDLEKSGLECDVSFVMADAIITTKEGKTVSSLLELVAYQLGLN